MNINHGSLRANIVKIPEQRIFLGEITWKEGIITRITEWHGLDPASAYLLPGFIDAHIHIESSMLMPAEFARIACRHGTIATVSDPHEIANVMGLEGVRYMYENASQTPMPIFFGAPPCVPEIKLSDRGLFDSRTFSFTPLTV